MSEKYISNHFDDIKNYANVIENRVDDEYCTLENVIKDNQHYLNLAEKNKADYVLIDDDYEAEIDLQKMQLID